jgi:ADP-dependent phosphofructokinase/glucokinase
MAQSWKDAGIGLIHLEMAGYESPDCRDKAIAGLTGSVTSIGMSLSEFRGIDPSAGSLREGLPRLGNHVGLDRVSVHADWAISATRRDPDQEREALMMGCLLASARSATSGPVVPSALPPGAHFLESPAGETHNGWHIFACPSPHPMRPRTTRDLGDTFMAGCPLVLGQAKLSIRDADHTAAKAEAG